MVADSVETAELVERAVTARAALVDERHEGALRLFHGFVEGCPDLAIDLYGTTLVVHDYALGGDEAGSRGAAEVARARLPWVRAVLWKAHRSQAAGSREGALLFGDAKALARKIREDGVSYATPLTMHAGCGLYLDTRNLRAWAKGALGGKRVLNTFAYTGSLGVAARAAPAAHVVHVDRSKAFLNVAKQTYAMNGFDVSRADFVASDFFEFASRARRSSDLYDCVFVDPPPLSETPRGRVDLSHIGGALDKVRPLVGDGGWLVVVNNALFVSGADFMAQIEAASADGYVSLETTIPAPEDFVGFAGTRAGDLPTDPRPFNAATKIAVLRVRRKDGRSA